MYSGLTFTVCGIIMLNSFFFIVSFSALVSSQDILTASEGSNDLRCDVDVSARRSCGDSIAELDCVRRGCCYDSCHGEYCQDSIPSCYMSSYMVTDECEVDEAARKDCGFYGINMDACLIRGCCWKPSDNNPWCFLSSTHGSNAISPVPAQSGATGHPGLEWESHTGGSLPPRSNAVTITDRSHDTYYVGRIKALGGIFPSKIHTRWGAAYFGYEELEITSKDFDALVLDNSSGGSVSWTSASNGQIPAGAIAGGYAPNDPQHLYYVAKAATTSGDQPGYLDPEQGCAVISYGWGSLCYSDYSVLVWSD